jgi:hypothetical protein
LLSFRPGNLQRRGRQEQDGASQGKRQPFSHRTPL